MRREHMGVLFGGVRCDSRPDLRTLAPFNRGGRICRDGITWHRWVCTLRCWGRQLTLRTATFEPTPPEAWMVLLEAQDDYPKQPRLERRLRRFLGRQFNAFAIAKD